MISFNINGKEIKITKIIIPKVRKAKTEIPDIKVETSITNKKIL
jgi:hypothetical protein